WIDALAPTGWEVSWAPQIEGKDKRMWLRVAEVFEEKQSEGAEDKKKNDKVIAAVRKVFDNAGQHTINAFKSGTGIIVTFALPAHVDQAATARTISIDGKNLWVNRVRQIEISYAFEIAIGGTTGIDETAMHNVRGWFAAFEREGRSLLAEARHAPAERDYLIISMHDWAATADVLSDSDRFREEITKVYGLRAPQLLFTLNTDASWRADPSTVITEGAAKVTKAIDLLTRRVDNNERESRARNAEMKERLVVIDKNVSTVTNLAVSIGNRQEDTARMTYRTPVDDDERKEARADITRLKGERDAAQAQLDALHGNIPRLTPAGPSIPAPPSSPPTSTTPLTPPGIVTLGPRSQPDDAAVSANKRTRRSITPDSAADVATQLTAADQDEEMPTVVRYPPHRTSNKLMATRLDSKGSVMIKKPCLLQRRVIAVDIILQANDGSSFPHRVIGAYAPWDPGTPATRDFWPELTNLVQSTTTSWTLGGDLNATVSASER
ncbi:hypothetical protein C8F04DRAFT_914980, partial [Mycena alexandri]